MEIYNKDKELYVIGPRLYYQRFELGENKYMQGGHHSSEKLNGNK